MRLLVFPGDSMETFFRKGELKARYYNPENFFDEVHFITFTEKDVDEEKIKAVAGSAKVKIHALGRLTPQSLFAKRKRVLEEVKKINPDAIRAFTPSIHGYFAAYCAKKLHVPYVLSIHGDFDRDVRYFYWKTRQLKNWAQSFFMKVFCEKYAISNADEVICAYNFPVPYAKKNGAKKVTVIYNKVYAKNFDDVKPALNLAKPAVICVGRLIPEKNQECLIRAIKEIDAYLILVGNGPLYPHLVALAKELGVEKKVLLFKSIPNKELPTYYKSASVFALPIKYGGVAIPVIEAMAAGLPVIVSRPELDENPEIASEAGMVVENTPIAFANAIKKVLSDKNLRDKMIASGTRVFSGIEGKKMEAKEAAIYKGLVSKWKLK